MSHVKACTKRRTVLVSILAEYAAACDTLGFGGEPAGSLNRRSSDGDVLKCVSILSCGPVESPAGGLRVLKELCLFDPILWCRENDVYLTGAEESREKWAGGSPFQGGHHGQRPRARTPGMTRVDTDLRFRIDAWLATSPPPPPHPHLQPLRQPASMSERSASEPNRREDQRTRRQLGDLTWCTCSAGMLKSLCFARLGLRQPKLPEPFVNAQELHMIIGVVCPEVE